MALLQKAYLGSTPLFRNTNWYEDASFNFVDVSSAVTVTANTSAHTKGSWAQIIASTSANASLLYVVVSGIGASTVNTATLLDIATGASGSETAIAENIAVGAANGVTIAIPFKIPSGTRLSARIQSVVTGGKTATVTMLPANAGNYADAPTSVDVIGGNTANSQGISFSGASGNWVQGVASTSRAYRAVSVVLSSHTDSSAAAADRIFELGVGAASSEVQFGAARQTFTSGETTSTSAPGVTLFGRNIPAGSRLAMQSRIAANPERYGFTLIGIP
jgi:hypothetical protein